MELKNIRQIIRHGKNIKRLNELELSFAGYQEFLSSNLQKSLALAFETDIIPNERQSNADAIVVILNQMPDNGELLERWFTEYGNAINVAFSWKKTFRAGDLVAFSLNASKYPDDSVKASFVYRFTGNVIDVEIEGDCWL